jgi:6-phosphofructokinase 2
LPGTRVVLDTAGPALAAALDAGVYLVKPSHNELRGLTGRALVSEDEWHDAAQGLIRDGRAQMVALTLGSRARYS